MTASIIEAKINHPNQSKSATSFIENKLKWSNEITTVVAVKTSIPGRTVRTPDQCSCRAYKRLPSPYDKSGPAYICASTGDTFQGHSVDINAGAKNNNIASVVTRMPCARRKPFTQLASAGPGRSPLCVSCG